MGAPYSAMGRHSRRIVLNSGLLASCTRFRATRHVSLFGSMPMPLRWQFMAATSVVPVPQNGSRTVSPQNENIRMSRSAIRSGKGFCSSFRESAVTVQHCRNHR